jgi:hypothetical protein
VGVDAQGERWVAVAEVFGELLNRDAPGEHDAGVIVPELVEAFPAGGDVAGPAALVFGGFRDQASFGQSGFPDDFGVVAGLDVLAVGVPAEQDVAGIRFAVQLLPRESAFLRRVLFYAMDCYRHLAEDRLAGTLATEVIQASTDFDGTERAPMRLAEARITLGVVAARQGDLD